MHEEYLKTIFFFNLFYFLQVSYTWVKVDHCRYVNDAAYEPLVLIDNRKKYMNMNMLVVQF